MAMFFTFEENLADYDDVCGLCQEVTENLRVLSCGGALCPKHLYTEETTEFICFKCRRMHIIFDRNTNRLGGVLKELKHLECKMYELDKILCSPKDFVNNYYEKLHADVKNEKVAILKELNEQVNVFRNNLRRYEEACKSKVDSFKVNAKKMIDLQKMKDDSNRVFNYMFNLISDKKTLYLLNSYIRTKNIQYSKLITEFEQMLLMNQKYVFEAEPFYYQRSLIGRYSLTDSRIFLKENNDWKSFVYEMHGLKHSAQTKTMIQKHTLVTVRNLDWKVSFVSDGKYLEVSINHISPSINDQRLGECLMYAQFRVLHLFDRSKDLFREFDREIEYDLNNKQFFPFVEELEILLDPVNNWYDVKNDCVRIQVWFTVSDVYLECDPHEMMPLVHNQLFNI
jgi:hypothetical protein